MTLDFANAILLAGYLVHIAAPTQRDELRLRILLTIGAVLFFGWGVSQGNWIAIGFNSLFFAISLYKIITIWRRRRYVELDREQAGFHEALVPDLTTREVYDLWMLGTSHDSTEPLTQQGEPVEDIVVLLAGECDVHVDGKQVNRLSAHAFVGEISFFRGGQATATVTPRGPIEARTWPREVLHTIEHLEPELHRSFVRAMAVDLADKING